MLPHSMQAIKCFLAVLHAAGGRQLPAAEASVRLQLATLLLDHTHNVAEARQHLEQAVLSPLRLPPIIFPTIRS